jgi:hypothetical protein
MVNDRISVGATVSYSTDTKYTVEVHCEGQVINLKPKIKALGV